MNRLILSLLAGIACITVPTREATANDAIIAQFGSKVAQAMCADGGVWIEAYHISRDRCPEISLSVLGPCMTKVVAGRTVPLTSEAELQQLSESLYTCMKDSFLAQYGGSAK